MVANIRLAGEGGCCEWASASESVTNAARPVPHPHTPAPTDPHAHTNARIPKHNMFAVACANTAYMLAFSPNIPLVL